MIINVHALIVELRFIRAHNNFETKLLPPQTATYEPLISSTMVHILSGSMYVCSGDKTQ